MKKVHRNKLDNINQMSCVFHGAWEIIKKILQQKHSYLISLKYFIQGSKETHQADASCQAVVEQGLHFFNLFREVVVFLV